MSNLVKEVHTECGFGIIVDATLIIPPVPQYFI